MARIRDFHKKYTDNERSDLQAANEIDPNWQKEGREVAIDVLEYFVDEWSLIDEYIILAKIAKLIIKK